MGTIETTSSCSELLNFILHETISQTPFSFHHENTTLLPPPTMEIFPSYSSPEKDQKPVEESGKKNKKKKKKRAVCKNKQEAECQRMTHITVERNRRKLMNQHLAVLRSLLPESYVQRGDQASIVGGAIEFVKELEHHLQSLEAQKFLLTQQQQEEKPIIHDQNSTFSTNPAKECEVPQLPLYFQKLFSYPLYTWSQALNNNTSKSKGAMADIEVNLVQAHANLRVLSRKRLTHLSKFVDFLQTCYLSVLHLNVTTLDPSVLYSVSLKMEEGCWLKSADEIAGVVHHILGLIEEEADLCIDCKNEKWLYVY